MTLAEFKKKKSHWIQARSYWSWACAQPADEKRKAEDLANYTKACEMCEKIQKFEDAALTAALKGVNI